MFLLRKKRAQLPPAARTGLTDTVAGLNGQIDQLVSIIQDRNSTASDRITAAEIVRSYIDFQTLSSIQEVWYATKGLLEIENQAEVRRAGWRLTLSCIDHDEINNSGLAAYYHAIVTHSNIEDFEIILQCLEHLTKNGRRNIGIAQGPRHLPQVLLNWIQLLTVRTRELRTNPQSRDVAAQWGATTEESFSKLLEYTANTLKFNMASWDPTEIENLLLVIVAIIKGTSEVEDCRLGCTLISTVLAFGIMPATVLQPVLEVLCGIISAIPALQDTAKSIIESISVSHLQNSMFVRLCRILDSPTSDVTQAMRCAAATELKDLLIEMEGKIRAQQESAASSQKDQLQRMPQRRAGLLDDASANKKQTLVDIDMPIVEVLESYHNALADSDAPMKLVVVLLDCMFDLVTIFSTIRESHTSTWLWTDTAAHLTTSPNALILQINELFEKFSTSSRGDHKHKDLLDQFRIRLSELGSVLANMLKDKSSAIVYQDAILMCVRMSRVLTPAACKTVLDTIEALQFCTPGIYGWFDHLREVLENMYLVRADASRAQILRIVKNVFALDSDQDGWVEFEDLRWVINAVFSAFTIVDDETLAELIDVYVNYVFFSDPALFELATLKIEEAAATNAAAVDALTTGIAKAYRLYTNQSLTLLNTIERLAKSSVGNPEVFVKAWSVLCRIRSDRWDRLIFIEPVVEEAYGEVLFEMLGPPPKPLIEVHSIPSLVLKVSPDGIGQGVVDIIPLLEVMLEVFQSKETSERAFISVLLNAASQLAHYRLFFDCSGDMSLQLLRKFRDVSMQLVASGGATLPFEISTSKRQAAIGVIVHVLTVLFPNQSLFIKADHDRMIHTLVVAMGQWNLNARWVMHCFTVACYEAPSSVQRYLPQILSRLQLKITSRDSSMYILDFLLSISLEGSLTKNFTEQDFKRVFGMCFSFIQNANDLLSHLINHSHNKSEIQAQWLLRLAYSAVENLFLAIPLEGRRSLIPYLVRNLVLANHDVSSVDPMSLVVYDMLNRFTYSDAPLRVHMDTVPEHKDSWDVKRWLRGVAVIEIRCNRRTGEAVRIIRRPAGIFTTLMKPAFTAASIADPLLDTSEDNEGYYSSNYYLLCGQLGLGTFQYTTIDGNGNVGPSAVSGAAGSASGAVSTAQSTLTNNNGLNGTSASLSSSARESNSNSNGNSSNGVSGDPHDAPPGQMGSIVPMPIPDDVHTNRAISSLDRVPMVDFYKVGIIYVAPGQKTEQEILANSSGSEPYRRFLDSIGMLVRLKHNRVYYVGGLDTEQDLDGKFALAWSSKISQIIFHTITMMPALPGDNAFANKKRHIGNDFVNIYFDESGQDFEFDVVKSQFNFINIVITPTYARAHDKHYWKVRVFRKPGMKNTLAAYEVKVVGEDNLALFVRNLCLKASQYAAIHNMGGDYTDNWVYRLQLILKLRDRVEQGHKPEESKSSGDGDDDPFDYLDPSANGSQGSEKDAKNADIKLLSWMDFTRYTF